MKSALPDVPVRSVESAPVASRDLLKAAGSKFGFVPNLLGMFANAPALLEGYLTLAGIFDKTSLSPTERQVVLLAVSFENGCEYCMAAHSAIAGMQKVDQGVISALRDGGSIADARLEALRSFAAEVVRTRGWPSPETVSRFTGAGYTPAQALEVVLGVGVKTLSNYANHLAATPLDAAFAPVKWSMPGCGCGTASCGSR
ncbi:MAG TPA: carboxymuconolactone decarboxylase [Phycisphaerales bacterium]|nr:carboxymuconolactone decarboxylase [Phycisphaerales bacterium]